MPRAPRLLTDNAYFHIVTRGNDKKTLFYQEQDYNRFKEIAQFYTAKYRVGIVHYCLMKNHIHLLMYTHIAQDLPKFMQVVLQVFGQSFRKAYGGVGFVFQNRYRSSLIDKDSYLLECARYIERNPLRVQVTQDLSEYPWSSFAHYAKGREDRLINEINPLYRGLDVNEEKRKQLYYAYVMASRPYDHIVDKQFRIR
jgi:putative transposase